MLKLFVKLDKDMKTLEVSAQRGKEILNTVKDSYQKDLSDKIIKGLDKNLGYVKLKKQEKIRGYFISESSSFVSNLIGNSVVSVFNWMRGKN
ncbi:hypothetical protein KKE99_00665 [Patescibacteria group bacterium]|nr:hypothetical protein [Patescibacteria group bacterium]